MPNHSNNLKTASSVERRWLRSRRAYSAVVVALAVLTLGMLLWPAPVTEVKAIATIPVDLPQPDGLESVDRALALREIESRFDDEQQLFELIKTLRLYDRPVSETFARDLAKRIQVDITISQGFGSSKNRVARIELQCADSNRRYPHSILNDLAESIARECRSDLSLHMYRESIDLFHDHLDLAEVQQARLQESLSRLPNAQWQQIEANVFSSQREGSETSSRPQGDQQANVDLNDHRPLPVVDVSSSSDSAPQMIENPAWVDLVNEAARIEWLRDKLMRQNLWGDSHPEIAQLNQELTVLTRRIETTDRYIADDSNDSADGGSLYPNQASNAVIENNRFTTGNNGGSNTPANAIGFPRTPSLSRESIRESLRAPFQDLDRQVREMASARQRAADRMGAIPTTSEARSARPEVNLSLIPANTHRRSRSLWRFALLLTIAGGAGGAFLYGTRRPSVAPLASIDEIERHLAIPVIGQLTDTDRSNSRSLRDRLAPAKAIVTGSEIIVFSAIAVVTLAAMQDREVALSLMDNPLNAVSNILSSIGK